MDEANDKRGIIETQPLRSAIVPESDEFAKRRNDNIAQSPRRESDVATRITDAMGSAITGITKVSIVAEPSDTPKPAYKRAATPEVKRHIRIGRCIVENKAFIVLTTILTISALTQDDIRLLWTNRPADQIFDVLVLTCFVVFSIEIFVSVLAKDDYFMGFFFSLDAVSTVTLLLDFSPVTEAMAGGGEDDDSVSSLRGGRTARVGAKAGRIVRVIRLVRILKLYKTIYEARERRRRRLERQQNQLSDPGDEDDWDEEDEMEEGQDKKHEEGQRQSRVGKKLSDMTTRRVICMVITMLLVFPYLTADASAMLAVSGWYGADNVWKSFHKWMNDENSTHKFEDYERSLLTYMFFHNWFADRGFCTADRLGCADRYFSHVFWMGIMGPKENEADISKYAAKARITLPSIQKFVAEKETQNDDIYVYGSAPKQGMEILASPWTTRCETKKKLRLGVSLLSQEIDGVTGYKVPCPENLRVGELQKFYTRMMTTDQWLHKWYIVFYFDLRPFVRTDAAFNMLVTGFICIVLCSAALSFTNDANKLVLRPVENMIRRVEAIRRDPLVAMQMADEEFKAELVAKAKLKRSQRLRIAASCRNRCARAKSEPMETVILEKTIIKLGSLLALGFGEAGAGIISQNIRGSETAGVNGMIPGVSVDCILGIARIRNFSTTNVVLQGSIMNFSNEIAEVVHGVVNEYHGAANKNNGDSFLLVWRMGENDLRDCSASRMAELALISFAKVIGGIHHSPLLAEYRGHPGLQQRLGRGTRVNLSFGLHFGWAIEGAVGTEFKIDASYLSPNVSIANSIERATGVYDVPFIVAESVFELLGTRMQSLLRVIDRVRIIGSPTPMRLFSVDLDTLAVKVGPPPLKIAWNPRNRFKARQYLETEKDAKLAPDLDTVDLFDSDPNIQAMRQRYTVEFMKSFSLGYQNYSQGEWPVARRVLMSTQMMLGIEDGPSMALLEFMERYLFMPPKDWKDPGARDLDVADSRGT